MKGASGLLCFSVACTETSDHCAFSSASITAFFDLSSGSALAMNWSLPSLSLPFGTRAGSPAIRTNRALRFLSREQLRTDGPAPPAPKRPTPPPPPHDPPPRPRLPAPRRQSSPDFIPQ